MKLLIENHEILWSATGDPRAIGGAERQQWLLAQALARRGHEVVVASFSHRPGAERRLEGVRFVESAPKAPTLAWPCVLARERPDWVYRRCADFYLGYIAPVARLAGARVVYSCAFDSDCVPERALARRRYLWPMFALGLSMADRILIQHEGQRALLPDALRPKAFLVPSVAASPGGTAVPAGGEPYVAWVGLLREPKRPHLVVELARRLPGVRFVVCGPPSDHRTSPEYAAAIVPSLRGCPNIDYRGAVPPDEAQRVLAGAAVLLSTSLAEGFPNTLLQAWSAGVPAVSLELDPGGSIRRYGGGRVARDVEEAAAAIARYLDDDDERGRDGRLGLEYVRSHHGEDVVVERFLRALA